MYKIDRRGGVQKSFSRNIPVLFKGSSKVKHSFFYSRVISEYQGTRVETIVQETGEKFYLGSDKL